MVEITITQYETFYSLLSIHMTIGIALLVMRVVFLFSFEYSELTIYEDETLVELIFLFSFEYSISAIYGVSPVFYDTFYSLLSILSSATG